MLRVGTANDKVFRFAQDDKEFNVNSVAPTAPLSYK